MLVAEWYIDTSPLTTADYERLAQLELLLFGPDAWSLPTISMEIGGQMRRYFFARRSSDDVIIGYAGVQYAGVADVNTIGVDPDWRRRGIARALMGKLEQAAHQLYAEFGDDSPVQLLLEVRKSNEAAQALYKNLGFQVIDTVARYYHNPLETAVIMRKRLPRPPQQ